MWYPPQAGCSTDPCREIEIDVRIAQAIEFSLEVVADQTSNNVNSFSSAIKIYVGCEITEPAFAADQQAERSSTVVFSFLDFSIASHCPNAFSYTVVDAANENANQDSSPFGLAQPTTGPSNQIIPYDVNALNSYLFYLQVEVSGDYTDSKFFGPYSLTVGCSSDPAVT